MSPHLLADGLEVAEPNGFEVAAIRKRADGNVFQPIAAVDQLEIGVAVESVRVDARDDISLAERLDAVFNQQLRVIIVQKGGINHLRLSGRRLGLHHGVGIGLGTRDVVIVCTSGMDVVGPAIVDGRESTGPQ